MPLWAARTTVADPSGRRDDVPVSSLLPEETSGWSAYVVWAICGALWAFSFLSFVGPVVWPLAAALTWLAFKYTSQRRDALGLVAGAGAFVLFTGLLHIRDLPCDSPRAATASGCGGFDSKPWLIIGSIVLLGAVLLYRSVRQRQDSTDAR